MTQETISKNADRVLSSGDARSDPHLVNIYELGQLMTLSPRALIDRIDLDAAAKRVTSPVAQNRANDPSHEGPTESALASLASLVSTLERNTLLAEPPTVTWSHSHRPVPATARGEEPSPQDDEAVPILSTWRQPATPDDDRGLRQDIYAAVFGLIVALAVILAVLLLIGTPLTPKSGEILPVRAAVKPAPAKVVENPVRPVVSPVSADGPHLATPYDRAAVETVAELPSRDAKLVQEARRRMEGGDATGAREVLTAVATDPQGLAAYALAETYDPNMLAALGIRNAAADVARAKDLYRQALDLGVARATLRLDALQ